MYAWYEDVGTQECFCNRLSKNAHPNPNDEKKQAESNPASVATYLQLLHIYKINGL